MHKCTGVELMDPLSQTTSLMKHVLNYILHFTIYTALNIGALMRRCVAETIRIISFYAVSIMLIVFKCLVSDKFTSEIWPRWYFNYQHILITSTSDPYICGIWSLVNQSSCKSPCAYRQQCLCKPSNDFKVWLCISLDTCISNTCLPKCWMVSLAKLASAAVNFGVLFDSTFILDDHVAALCKSTNSNFIGKIRKHLDTPTADKMINCSITSCLDYCNNLPLGTKAHNITQLQLWGGGY